MNRAASAACIALAAAWATALPLACNSTSDSPAPPSEPLLDGGLDGATDGATDDGGIPDGEADASPVSDAASDAADGSTPITIQLLRDHRFLNGFHTYPVQPSTTPVGALVPPTATGDPEWRLSEWHTQQLLPTGPPTVTSLGAEWANSYKRVVVDDSFLELAINAEAEYGGVYRQSGEQWPHLLIAQQIFDDAAPDANTRLYGYQSVTLSLSLELVYASHIQEAGYDPDLHACQFLMFVTLQNRNTGHQDYGDFIWFGLPFYDDRYATLSENVALDAGTGKYMFRMASSNFMPASLHDVASVDVSVNLLPYMKSAVEDAIAQGILSSSDLDDYFIGGMNLGFEVPGRSTATMRVRDLSMIAEIESLP